MEKEEKKEKKEIKEETKKEDYSNFLYNSIPNSYLGTSNNNLDLSFLLILMMLFNKDDNKEIKDIKEELKEIKIILASK